MNTIRLRIKVSCSLLLLLIALIVRFRDFGSLKFVHSWIGSLLSGRSPLSDEVPWITFKARAWLESYLKPNMSAFEYGSGGSTIFLSKRVNELISVEHDKGWCSRVSDVLSKAGISNCKLSLIEPEKKISGEMPIYSCRSYTATPRECEQYVGKSFEGYVRSIEEYPDRYFDLVFVDGMARLSCIFHALSKIRPGGYLLLDNSDLPEYKEARSFLADYKRTDFFGIGPYLYEVPLWQTSVWEIKS